MGREGRVSGSGRDSSRTPRPCPLPPQRARLAPRAWQPALCPAPCHTPGRHCSPSLPLPGEWGPQPGLALLLSLPEGDPRKGKRGLTTSGRPPLLGVTDHLIPCYLGPLEEFSPLYMTFGKSLNLSEAQFSHIYNGDHNNLCLAHTLFKLQDEIRNLCKSTWKAKIFFSMLETE